MQVSRIIFGLCILVLGAGLAFGKVRTDYDHSVDFSKYRTFAWVQEPKPSNVFMKDRIVDAINAQLIGKGLEADNPQEADIAISASATTREVQTLNTYYSGGWGGWGWDGCGWGWGWDGCGWGGGSGWATTTVDVHQEGTLIVDLVDAKTHRPLWRGMAVHTVSDKPEKATKKLQKEIKKMFEKYPPSPGGK
jgi:hypothetical protein